MIYRGRVHDGMVVLDDPSGLAEGTEVEVVPVGAEQTLAPVDPLKDVIGKAESLPANASRNKRHYLYRQPKE
jgi:hypothetical protein